MIKSGTNPQQLVLNMLKERAGNNPQAAMLISLAENNNVSEIEKYARQALSQQGYDYDKEFTNFKNSLGL